MADSAAGARRYGARMLVVGAMLAAQVLIAPGFAGAAPGSRGGPPAAGEDTPQLADILECGWGVVGGTIAKGSTVAVGRALDFFQHARELGDLWEAARLAYGRDLADMSADERADLVLILSGLASCAKVSPTLLEAIQGILELLGPPVGTVPAAPAGLTVGTVPAAPTGLAVVSSGPHAMLISWDDRSTGETGFEVNNGEVSVLVGPDVTEYRWDGLAPRSYMCLHVRSLNGPTVSPWEPADAPYYRCTTTPSERPPGRHA